jgi:tetratricopeptide (TPR) repeat protein
MKRGIVFLVLLFVLGTFLPSFSQIQEKPKDTKQLLEKGIDLYRSGEYEEAIKVFSEVLKLSVDKNEIIRTYVYFAYTYFAMNELDKALVQVYEAIKQSPEMTLKEEEFPADFIKFFDTAKNQVVGTLFIESTPDRARVWIDKKEFGSTPLKTQLPAQRYYLRVVKGGYSPHEETIEIRSDSIIPIKIDLNKKKNWKSFALSSLIFGAITVLAKSI